MKLVGNATRFFNTSKSGLRRSNPLRVLRVSNMNSPFFTRSVTFQLKNVFSYLINFIETLKSFQPGVIDLKFELQNYGQRHS